MTPHCVLRLVASLCPMDAQHTCRPICDVPVDTSGVHGLACRKSAVRHMRHNRRQRTHQASSCVSQWSVGAGAKLIVHAEAMKNVLAVWLCCPGLSMVWDFTCPDNLATSHLNRSVLLAGSAANEAESRNVMEFRSLSAGYSFVPVTVESLGALGEEASDFFRNLGHRITSVTTELRSLQFLIPVPDAAAAMPRACYKLFKLQSDRTNCFIYSCVYCL